MNCEALSSDEKKKLVEAMDSFDFRSEADEPNVEASIKEMLPIYEIGGTEEVNSGYYFLDADEVRYI